MPPSGTDRLSFLSPSHRELLASVRDRWTGVAMQTGAGDHAPAELAVRELYLLAGLRAPGTILWLRSPLEGAIAAYFASQQSPSVLARVRSLLSLPVQAQLERLCDPAALAEIRTTLGDPYWRTVRHLLRHEIGHRPHHAAGDRVFREVHPVAHGRSAASMPPPWDLVWPLVMSQTQRCGFGLQEASSLGFLDLFRRLRIPGPVLSGLDALAAVSQGCGWWWPFERVCILTERPVTMLRDELGRLHSENTPALEYADRFGIYAIGGVGVPAGTIRERNLRVVAAILSERNAEIRRVMLERFGLDRLVRMGFARTLDRERGRALYELSLPGRSPLVVVQVTCPTTGHEYILGVPPGIWRCHDAVAWTFGMQPHEYAPLQET